MFRQVIKICVWSLCCGCIALTCDEVRAHPVSEQLVDIRQEAQSDSFDVTPILNPIPAQYGPVAKHIMKATSVYRMSTASVENARFFIRYGLSRERKLLDNGDLLESVELASSNFLVDADENKKVETTASTSFPEGVRLFTCLDKTGQLKKIWFEPTAAEYEAAVPKPNTKAYQKAIQAVKSHVFLKPMLEQGDRFSKRILYPIGLSKPEITNSGSPPYIAGLVPCDVGRCVLVRIKERQIATGQLASGDRAHAIVNSVASGYILLSEKTLYVRKLVLWNRSVTKHHGRQTESEMAMKIEVIN